MKVCWRGLPQHPRRQVKVLPSSDSAGRNGDVQQFRCMTENSYTKSCGCFWNKVEAFGRALHISTTVSSWLWCWVCLVLRKNFWQLNSSDHPAKPAGRLEIVVIQWPWTVHNFRVHTGRQEGKDPVVKKKCKLQFIWCCTESQFVQVCTSTKKTDWVCWHRKPSGEKSYGRDDTEGGEKLRHPPLKPREKIGETLKQSPFHGKSVNPGNIPPSDKVHVVKKLNWSRPCSLPPVPAMVTSHDSF